MKYGITLFLCLSLFLVGCSNADDSNESATDANETETTDIAFQLRKIDQKVENNQVDVTAEVSTSENEIYYKIEQGEDLLQEQSIKIDTDANWYPITITYNLTEDQVSAEEPPIITVYVKGEDEEVLIPNYIPIDVE